MFVQRGDEVGAAAAVDVECVALAVGVEVLPQGNVVGDVAATEAVNRLFRVADE